MATALRGVSVRTIYNLARKGDIPATRVGRERRFARRKLIGLVSNAIQANHLTASRRNGRAVMSQR